MSSRAILLIMLGLLLTLPVLPVAAADAVCRSTGPGAWVCTEAEAPLPVFRIVTLGDVQTFTQDGVLMTAGSNFCNGQQGRPEVVKNSCLVVVAPLNEDGIYSGRHRIYAQWYEYPQ